MTVWVSVAITLVGGAVLLATEYRDAAPRVEVGRGPRARRLGPQRRRQQRVAWLAVWLVTYTIVLGVIGLVSGDDLTFLLSAPGLAILAAAIATGGHPRRLVGPNAPAAVERVDGTEIAPQAAPGWQVSLFIVLILAGCAAAFAWETFRS